MKTTYLLIASALVLLSITSMAANGRNNTDVAARHSEEAGGVIIDLPPQTLTQQNRNNTLPCLRCCIFENHQYSEGAVVKSEGVLLQCVRDEHSLGTNNLIWKIIRQ
ncbi:hypothetical protein BL250_03880 [Erwinia sp. OLTSP20]|uniref:DUF1496 domain-containing protein n=1 Tax=unclassified Erwinia TaxID=2622719 RepID=UPI000C18EA68|nr:MULTISPECIES: DUF1496 domain-containing protein [unclassified Erwinia]PIJ51641.1 hypothetical protein BV501_02810 [Erwinia sp. OAMSP11]PIJ69718.1 hypothetical protein BK416_14065 [Erwinia sp. OLSSP12]PIJ79441.1 hypothetical protein BLD47_14145 [Erwinia sp. OLCASP19]PIJ86611.1 hypothetical protein BLD46_02635 [Erwinia sp. OLMTSP26]PIJ88052.1 hypothetical protein BLD49_03315 [Erwinia sp. OLMDSP33]